MYISLANWIWYHNAKPQLLLFVKLRRNRRICRPGHSVYKIAVIIGSAITPRTKDESSFFSYEMLSRKHKTVVFACQYLFVMLVVPLGLKEFPYLGVPSVPRF